MTSKSDAETIRGLQEAHERLSQENAVLRRGLRRIIKAKTLKEAQDTASEALNHAEPH